MGLRTTLVDTLTRGAEQALDTVADRLVARALARQPIVRAEALAALADRVDAQSRSLDATRAVLDGVRQALEAWALEDDDELEDTSVIDAMEAAAAALDKQAARLDGALAELAERVGRVDGAARQAAAEAAQARQVATSALAAAESAASAADEEA